MVVPFFVAWFVYRDIPDCSSFVSFTFVSDMRADTSVRPYQRRLVFLSSVCPYKVAEGKSVIVKL